MNRIQQYRVIPVVVFNTIEEVAPKLQALCDGGLPIAEITFRTSCAKEAIGIAVKDFPDMLIGAGTVINAEQCNEAISIGAKFIVSPGYQADVSRICRENNVPYFPGCVTPTEIVSAVNDGWTTIKFFPANVYGGLKAMKALVGPFPQIDFVPTGGVDASNLGEYLAWDKIKAVGGSWMMKGEISDIVESCQKIAEIVKG